MPGRVTRAIPAAMGVLLAFALLYPEPERGALVARGFARLLEQDAREALGPGRPDAAAGSIFRALERLAGPETRLRLSIARRALPTPAAPDPALERGFSSALNLVNADRESRGARPLVVAATGEGASLAVDLEIVEAEARVWIEAGVRRGAESVRVEPRRSWVCPSRTALVPPLLAILVALLFQRTVAALLAGIWVGAALLRGEAGHAPLGAILLGLRDVVAVYFRAELVDSFRIEIIGFVIALVAMVGVMSRGAGVQGLVESILRFARSVRSTLLVAFGMGCLIFFDDYSNCLIVGSTMRPLTDRLRISREKLAYVVDSTAAPVAGLSLLSTWIAFEVSTYSAQLPGAGISENPYAIFLRTVPFRYYCFFTLGLVLLVILVGRDFGPMHRAEARARRTGRLVRPGGTPMVSDEMTSIQPSAAMPRRARNAVLPIATVIVVTLEEIFRGGGGYALLGESTAQLLTLATLTELLFAGGGAAPVFAGASAGFLVATFLVGSNPLRVSLAVGVLAAALLEPRLAPQLQPFAPEGLADYAAVLLLLGGGSLLTGAALRLPGLRTRRPHLALPEIRRAAISSTRALGFAIVILFEAWMIGQVCEDVSTADYLVALTSNAVTPIWLPVLLFGVSCLVSFSTGTSWGTMSILLPNVVALAAALGAAHSIGSLGMVLVCIGAVLEGSIFGDHCSPISDTTILSSVASASDHVDHVRTQAPYALASSAVAVGAGYLPTLLFDFWSFPLAMVTGFAALLAALLLFGRAPGASVPTP